MISIYLNDLILIIGMLVYRLANHGMSFTIKIITTVFIRLHTKHLRLRKVII